MKDIAKNEYYDLIYDESKNWIYWTMRGFWKSLDAVPDFEKDWDKAIATAQKPFKIFADLSKLKAMPKDVQDANDQMQQKLMQNGCIKVSAIMDSIITKISLNEVIEKSGMEKMVKYFDNADEANVWLSAE
ncbi:MAG: hypothetical protein HQK83_19610 [Fibrobacteria bacterium]|nr:hypothetical protein [Fibrobacteria bacterium]